MDRRMLAKLLALMSNPSNLLHETTNTEQQAMHAAVLFLRSIFPEAIRLFTSLS